MLLGHFRRTRVEPLLALAESRQDYTMRDAIAEQRVSHFAKISATAMLLVLAMSGKLSVQPHSANTLLLRHAIRSVSNSMWGTLVRSPRDRWMSIILHLIVDAM